MKILFITSTRLGDGVLSTGVIDHFIRRYPGAEITVACGGVVTGLFEALPGIARIIPVRKQPYYGHWIKLGREVMGTRWDIVIDIRNSLLSRLLLARKKYIWGKQDRRLHKVEQMAQVIGVSPPPPPRLWFSDAARAGAEKLVPDGPAPVLAVGPTANWVAKTWPAENFIELLQQLTAPDGILPGARIAIFPGPGEEALTRRVLDAFPAERRIHALIPPAEAAAAIARCQFYVGNDSGLMHCAAAVGVPTLGLFGPTWPHLYHPWGPNAAWVATPEDYAQLTAYPGYDPRTAPCLMTTLSVEAVRAAAEALWARVQGKERAA